jgi:excisionase family DNA binding protein
MAETTTSILTLTEVARLLKIPYARAAELTRQNVLPHFRLGRQIRISRSALDDFIAAGGRPLDGGWRRAAR